MFCCMLLALASQKERKQRWIIHHVLDARRQVRAKYTGSQRYVLIREHHWIVFSSQIFRLELFSIYFFYFPQLFINIFSFIKPKNHFSTIDQGFPIYEKSFEALVRFISSSRTFSSFHQSLSVSKSKNTKKLSFDFNLLTFLSVDSTSTCHCSNLNIRF